MAGGPEVLVPVSFFGMIAAIIIVPKYFRSVERQKLAETLRSAIERGLPLDAVEKVFAGLEPPPSAQRDLHTGIVWLGVGLGLTATALTLGFAAPDASWPLIGVAAFPLSVGLAYIAMSQMRRSRG